MSESLDKARHRVGAAQVSLIRALVAGGPPPPGFDRHRIDVQAEALRRKRSRSAAAALPDLRVRLGADWDRAFDEYARAHPLESSQRRSDAALFRSWLRRC